MCFFSQFAVTNSLSLFLLPRSGQPVGTTHDWRDTKPTLGTGAKPDRRHQGGSQMNWSLLGWQCSPVSRSLSLSLSHNAHLSQRHTVICLFACLIERFSIYKIHAHHSLSVCELSPSSVSCECQSAACLD